MADGSLSDREVAIRVKGTLNDLPVPQGDWQEYHKQRNTKWNALLAASAAFFGLTMFVVSFFVNMSKITCYVQNTVVYITCYDA